jgi:hypothetical protein
MRYSNALVYTIWIFDMKIQLTLRGGIYGVVELEPVDPSDIEPGFGEEALRLLNECATGSGNESKSTGSDATGLRTEQQTFSFRVEPDSGDEKVFTIGEDALTSHPRLQALFDTLWRQARPRPSQ